MIVSAFICIGIAVLLKACDVCVSYLAIAERRFTGHVVNFICRDMDEPYEVVCELERYGD